jgi:sugar phosphate isomerase/epimerase
VPDKEAKKPVALQMYSVREEAARDYLGTLKAVAGVGYKAVELAGYGDMTAAELRGELDSLGISAVSSHVALALLRDGVDQAIDDCLTLGCRYLICPWLPEQERGDADRYRRLAAELNALGARCRERGLGFAYHNHDFEFKQFDGKYALDILREGTDPRNVKFELDVYWAFHAGVDPAAFLSHLGHRCGLVHLKDMTTDAERTFAEVGEGQIAFRPIFAAADQSGVDFYVVEQDRCRRPALESVAISLKNLTAWGIA